MVFSLHMWPDDLVKGSYLSVLSQVAMALPGHQREEHVSGQQKKRRSFVAGWAKRGERRPPPLQLPVGRYDFDVAMGLRSPVATHLCPDHTH
jgi:hypothetical protein